ncbi:MAG: hypothetical protein WBV94_34890 [Blastocatellia bacterium]
MTVKQTIIAFAFLLTAVPAGFAQGPVKSAALTQDQIGLVRAAVGITTRISFPEVVKEIVCGDLYDPASGKGSFVVQRSDNDVFLKPVVGKGLSNLFVKTGENGEHVYNFDLTIVPVEQANRVFNIVKSPASVAQTKAVNHTEQQGAEIIRAARLQAEQITTQAKQQAAEAHNQAIGRIPQEIELRFANALILGLQETKLGNARVIAKGATLTLDPRVLTFNGKTYLRYTVQNKGDNEIVYNTVALEIGSGDSRKVIAAEIVQSRSDNRVKAGQAITGVLIFDQKQAPSLDKLTLYLRGEENSEIARVVISR